MRAQFLTLLLSAAAIASIPTAATAQTEKKNKPPVSKAEFMKQAYDRFSKLDTDYNGVLSAEEIRAKRTLKRKKTSEKRFSNLDTNKDGYLSEDEYITSSKEKTIKAQERFEKSGEDWFDKADEDGNGYLSRDEYLTQRRVKRARYLEPNVDRLRTSYKRLDIDEDGIVSREEYVDKKGRFGKTQKTKNSGVFSFPDGKGGSVKMVLQDANKDKKISRDENEKFQQFVFKSMDKDGDGKITAKENKSMRYMSRMDATR